MSRRPRRKHTPTAPRGGAFTKRGRLLCAPSFVPASPRPYELKQSWICGRLKARWNWDSGKAPDCREPGPPTLGLVTREG
jgi:hypothetical protein